MTEPIWTEEQVAYLVQRQADPAMHPYTCGGGGGTCSGISLTPTVNGWVCENCGRTQDWAHQYDLEGTWPGRWPLP
jgi:hypothetical protein